MDSSERIVGRRSFLQLSGGLVVGPGVVDTASRDRSGRSSGGEAETGTGTTGERETVETTVVRSVAVRDLLASLADERPMEWEYISQDNRIRAADQGTVARLLLAEDDTESMSYSEDAFDCEDFAWRVRMDLIERFGVYNVGVVLDYNDVEDHAYNLVVYPDGDHALFEPQEDVFFSPTDGTKYAFRDVVVLL